MKRLLAIAVLLLFTSHASAALLFQFHNTGDCYDCGPPQALGFDFNVGPLTYYPPPIPLGDWTMTATQADAGKTFWMPADKIPLFNLLLTSPENIYGSLRCCGHGGGGHSFATPWTAGNIPNVFTTERFAPNLGPNLKGYYVTGISNTVDALAFEQIDPQTWRANGRQTISIYGEVVPEPATLVLLLMAFTMFASRRTRIG